MIGPALAIGILAAILATLIPAIRRSRQEDRELEARIRCGPGYICGGENVSRGIPTARQHPDLLPANLPEAMIIQAPPQVVYVQAPAPMFMQASQPQVIYLPAPQMPSAIHSQIEQPTQQQKKAHRESFFPQGHYPGYTPEPTDYPHFDGNNPRPSNVHYLPPQQPVGQLPPARASDIEEARRKWEREREEMKRHR